MKHVLVTGGSGFIGSHLCDALLARGYAVTAIDNFVTGRRQNLVDALRHPEFELIEGDVSRPVAGLWGDNGAAPSADLAAGNSLRLLRKYGLQGVLHFACPASPVDFDRIPFEILAVDSIGTLNTVGLALRHGARYLVASTSETYGDPLVHPQTEDYWGNVNSIGPRACYDEAKRFAEACVSTAIRGVGRWQGEDYAPLNGGIVRIFNTYGPRMRADDGRVVPELCCQALKGLPLTLHGDGKQTRSFCFVSDLVEGIIRLFESDVKVPVNIGNTSERTMLEFAETVSKLTGSASAHQFLPARPDDPRRRCPDIGRAKQHLKWEPKISLEEGLRQSLEYFRTEL